ncbi:CBS domain-containing protein [Anopheles sinensis]|uniref:CBS domain-containing protein n=1 Tax=Anopheles sinensis TaxID=74873 RepID=A0A084VPV7_ANOSI|nr:CBS domain-containing protein [Anopheles sinensis]
MVRDCAAIEQISGQCGDAPKFLTTRHPADMMAFPGGPPFDPHRSRYRPMDIDGNREDVEEKAENYGVFDPRES